MIFRHRDAGFDFVKRLFEKNGLRVLSTSFYNKRRHMLLNLRDDRDVESFVYVLFNFLIIIKHIPNNNYVKNNHHKS